MSPPGGESRYGRTGGLEDWRTGGLEDWRTGGLEDWRTGGLEDLGEEVLEDVLLNQLVPHQARAQEGVGVHQGESTVVDVVGP